MVETGLPLWRPSRARGYVVTYGGSRASYEAAADLLGEGVPRVSSHLERELAEQPQALARLIDRQRANAEEIASLFRRPDVQYILIASRGSSSNAARYAQYVLGRAHRVPVAFATPSLYTLYEQPPRLDGALVLGISQSGESPDVKAVIEEARRQGRPTVAITNDPASPLAAASDAVLPIEAGAEQAVAATKTYINSLGAIALLFVATTGAGLGELAEVPAQLGAAARASKDSAEALQLLDGGTVVARGVNYGTAFEIALKIRELSGLLFEAYSGADLMHGPVAAVSSGWPVFALAPSGPAMASMDRGDRRCRAPRRQADRRLGRRSPARASGRRVPVAPRCAGVAQPADDGRARAARGDAARTTAGHRSRPAARALEGHAHPLASRDERRLGRAPLRRTAGPGLRAAHRSRRDRLGAARGSRPPRCRQRPLGGEGQAAASRSHRA